MDIKITLDQLLASRDSRRERQQMLLKEYENQSLVCLTVIMPGQVKRNYLSLTIADVASRCLLETFPRERICHFEQRDLPTGYEAYLVVDAAKDEVKQVLCRLEDTHPLGRLFDFDVIESNGSPMSRSAIGLPPRQCLLCEKEARYCMRQHSHTTEDLLAAIKKIVDDYLANKDKY